MKQEIRGLEPTPEEIQAFFLDTISSARNGLQASRVFAQRIGHNIPGEQQLELSRKMSSVFKALGIKNWGGVLFQLSETEIYLDHSAGRVKNKLTASYSIKGFNQMFERAGIGFDCFILDEGGSRSYYDNKSPNERNEFFLNGMKQTERGTSVHYAALVSDNGRQYTIEQFESYQPFLEIPLRPLFQ